MWILVATAWLGCGPTWAVPGNLISITEPTPRLAQVVAELPSEIILPSCQNDSPGWCARQTPYGFLVAELTSQKADGSVMKVKAREGNQVTELAPACVDGSVWLRAHRLGLVAIPEGSGSAGEWAKAERSFQVSDDDVAARLAAFAKGRLAAYAELRLADELLLGGRAHEAKQKYRGLANKAPREVKQIAQATLNELKALSGKQRSAVPELDDSASVEARYRQARAFAAANDVAAATRQSRIELESTATVADLRLHAAHVAYTLAEATSSYVHGNNWRVVSLERLGRKLPYEATAYLRRLAIEAWLDLDEPEMALKVAQESDRKWPSTSLTLILAHVELGQCEAARNAISAALEQHQSASFAAHVKNLRHQLDERQRLNQCQKSTGTSDATIDGMNPSHADGTEQDTHTASEHVVTR